MATKTKAKQAVQTTYSRKGVALALLVIPAGIVAWVLLWRFGFIASVVAWAIAAGAVWLYQLGASQGVTKAAVPFILAIILLGVVLAFLGGMASDALAAYNTAEIGGTGSMLSADFVSFFTSNLASASLWQSYAIDIAISLAFAALGAGGVVRDLYMKPAESEKAQ